MPIERFNESRSAEKLVAISVGSNFVACSNACCFSSLAYHTDTTAPCDDTCLYIRPLQVTLWFLVLKFF